MRHILPLPAVASLPAIQAAIAQSKAKRVALVFPLGEQTRLSNSRLLDTLQSYCMTTGIDVAILGGDAALRAAAVAAGFVVATTLEEWETNAHPAVRPSQRTTQSLDPVHLTVVRDRGDADDTDTPDEDTWDDELPEYVVELLGTDSTYTAEQGVNPLPVEYVSWDEAAAETEDDGEAVRVAAERYEETMTSTIRDTGRLPELPADMPKPPAPSSAADAEQSDGDSESY